MSSKFFATEPYNMAILINGDQEGALAGGIEIERVSQVDTTIFIYASFADSNSSPFQILRLALVDEADNPFQFQLIVDDEVELTYP